MFSCRSTSVFLSHSKDYAPLVALFTALSALIQPFDSPEQPVAGIFHLASYGQVECCCSMQHLFCSPPIDRLWYRLKYLPVDRCCLSFKPTYFNIYRGIVVVRRKRGSIINYLQ